MSTGDLRIDVNAAIPDKSLELHRGGEGGAERERERRWREGGREGETERVR